MEIWLLFKCYKIEKAEKIQFILNSESKLTSFNIKVIIPIWKLVKNRPEMGRFLKSNWDKNIFLNLILYEHET